MLIEFNVTNFRSFQETQTLSMAANNATELRNENTFNSGIKGLPHFLHSAVIYGPNAAGKSNLLLALHFMKSFVLSSANDGQQGKKIKVTPFLFHPQTNTQPCEFEVLFIQNSVRYQYGFAVTDERVTHEWLFAYPEKRAQRWFEREYDFYSQQENWHFGSKLKGHRQIWKEATRSNALFLSTAIQLNSEQLKPVFDWFLEKLKIGKSAEINPINTLQKCETESKKQQILEFMNAADLSIADIQLKTRKFSLKNEHHDVLQKLTVEIKSDNGKAEVELTETKVQLFHSVIGKIQKSIPLDLQEESDGTQRLFEFAGIWLKALDEGSVLGIDELESSLHPKLVQFLIDLFHNPDMNKKHAQLIFTTHDTTVQDSFRRDQIWFVEKNEGNATQLYPLSDFSPRKKEARQKGYLNGRYGALPYVKKLRRS
ncbi:RloA [Beggiatoa sp. PS]|nr:RloA [Beggiatoa sp. PS]